MQSDRMVIGVLTLPGVKRNCPQNVLDFYIIVWVTGTKQKVNVDGAIGTCLRIDAKSDIGKKELHVLETPLRILGGL
jgi:hypothetical protein